MGKPTITIKPTRYTVSAGNRSVIIDYRGDDSWAVVDNGNCLSVSGSWDHEPSPSNRTGEWLFMHRFSLDGALEAAMTFLGRTLA